MSEQEESKRTCETCRAFAVVNASAIKEGQCRLRAPAPTFPAVGKDEWCLEWVTTATP